MAYRRKSYTYWDGDAIFPIPFEYLEQDDILVFINDEQTTDFVIENTQVKLNNIPTEVPAIIKIVSATDIDKAIVDWENVSSLDEDNLILSDNQIRYAVQELYDNTEQFKTDTNQSFEDYKQETNQNIDNFREEIHTLLDDVSEAAELISSTIEAVDTAVITTQEQALLATEQKVIATEQANIATQQTELVASTANKALEDIETLTTNSINTIESLSENSTEEINTLGNTIKSDAADWIDVINATGKSYNMVTHRQITNCITEIPQDIKLELNDGVLTLKAGSKVYVPNGFEADGTTPKFDEVVVPNDMANTNFWGDVRFVVYDPNKGLLPMPVSDSFSGATQPATFQYALWYDTANNLVKSTTNNGATWSIGHSLPICTAYGTNGTTVTSIDQTFNGFGYIGSTVFMLPDVKFSVVWGKNEDGTYKTHSINNPTVKTLTRTSGALTDWVICTSIYNYEVYDIHYEKQCHITNGLPSTGTTYTSYFNMADGYHYYTNSGTTPERTTSARVKLINGVSCDANGVVTNFGQSRNVFAVVDQNEAVVKSDMVEAGSYIAGCAMPSNKYIDLGLGASGSTYTAPANGWLQCACTGTAGSTYFELCALQISSTASFTGGWARTSIPVKKGDVVTVYYGGNNFTAQLFRFTYAEGEV